MVVGSANPSPGNSAVSASVWLGAGDGAVGTGSLVQAQAASSSTPAVATETVRRRNATRRALRPFVARRPRPGPIRRSPAFPPRRPAGRHPWRNAGTTMARRTRREPREITPPVRYAAMTPPTRADGRVKKDRGGQTGAPERRLQQEEDADRGLHDDPRP